MMCSVTFRSIVELAVFQDGCVSQTDGFVENQGTKIPRKSLSPLLHIPNPSPIT